MLPPSDVVSDCSTCLPGAGSAASRLEATTKRARVVVRMERMSGG